MRVAVISDTHIPAASSKLPEALLEGLKGVDLIIHTGDLTEPYVLDDLKNIAPIEAVVGNMDSSQVRRILPEKKVLELEGFRIGLIHGNGSPHNLIKYVQEAFKNEKLDCIVYGHSHNPRIDKIDGTIYFNPGSVTDKVFAPYNSFGMLEIKDKIRPTIVRL